MIPEYAALVVAFALTLDMLCGDPPNRYHPTAWVGSIYGRLIPYLETSKMHKELAWGTIVVLGVCATVASLLFVLEYAISAILEGTVKTLILIILGTVLLKSTIAIRGMQTHAIRVAKSLDANDINCARGNLAMIVKRHTGDLEQTHLISGTLESISENTTDGITGSLFYFSLFGLPGAFVYRAVNTADSMIGYKNKIFSNLGRFAASCDTVLNYVPARLTAFVMVIAAMVLKMDWKRSYKTMRKYGSCTDSSNAGYTMAALAGALNVTLEKPKHYVICGGNVNLTTVHVHKAIRLMKATIFFFYITAVLPIMVALSYTGWWIHA
ncbi:MAG: cobalamin biosynthesis protein CobD [Cenarchaeum symbiont of Oopsacas minuta]|nr:cobalamin biosynthesis protein CobD [Cenarchaeum symbiont of Oopsacas minuta]